MNYARVVPVAMLMDAALIIGQFYYAAITLLIALVMMSVKSEIEREQLKDKRQAGWEKAEIWLAKGKWMHRQPAQEIQPSDDFSVRLGQTNGELDDCLAAVGVKPIDHRAPSRDATPAPKQPGIEWQSQ